MINFYPLIRYLLNVPKQKQKRLSQFYIETTSQREGEIRVSNP